MSIAKHNRRRIHTNSYIYMYKEKKIETMRIVLESNCSIRIIGICLIVLTSITNFTFN